MAFKSPQSLRLAAMAVATALALSACGGGSKEGAAAQKQGAAQQAPAPVVGVLTVQPTTVTLSTQLPGRLEARRSANVVSQVSGLIKKRLFQEGSYVKAGQPLYQLDDSSYVASLESARASLASAQASLAKANADLARYKPLVAADAISKQDYDAAIQAQRAGQASVEAARASIKAAQINVSRSRITAPISGFIGQSKVSEGTLLTAGGGTVLANIQQTDPMYVNVTQSADSVLKLRQQMADGTVAGVNGAIAVSILLPDGTEYGEKGRLLFVDPTVDESTGQITLRAEVPNDKNILMPNMYVRVNLPSAQINNAFLVPQQAVTRGDKNTVSVVKADGSLESKEVQVAGQQGSDWVITGGLNAGDKVVVDGSMIASMMGAKKVTPKEWQPEAAASAPAQASAQAASAPAEQAASADKK